MNAPHINESANSHRIVEKINESKIAECLDHLRELHDSRDHRRLAELEYWDLREILKEKLPNRIKKIFFRGLL